MGVYTEGKEILKDLINLAKENSDSSLREKVLDLQEKFYDMYEENRDLVRINEDLLNVLKKKEDVIWTNNSYYKIKNDDRKFCSKCFDDENKLISTQFWGFDLLDEPYNECPKCKNIFRIERN